MIEEIKLMIKKIEIEQYNKSPHNSDNELSQVMDRLRNYLVVEYRGKIWGKVTSEIEIAINEYLERRGYAKT